MACGDLQSLDTSVLHDTHLNQHLQTRPFESDAPTLHTRPYGGLSTVWKLLCLPSETGLQQFGSRVVVGVFYTREVATTVG